MEQTEVIVITYTLIIAIVTAILGAITKAFIDVIPDKYIPLQNLIIGIISGIICYYLGLFTTIIISLLTCVFITMRSTAEYTT